MKYTIETSRFTILYNNYYPKIQINHKKAQVCRTNNKSCQEVHQFRPFANRRTPPHAIAWYVNKKRQKLKKETHKASPPPSQSQSHFTTTTNTNINKKLTLKPKCLKHPDQDILYNYITIIPPDKEIE